MKELQNARAFAGVLVFALLSGCASIWPQTKQLAEGGLPAGIPEHVELTEVPFYPQKEYQCGPAALATALVASGVKVTPDELVPQVYLPARQGSLQVEMLAAARRHGLVAYQLAPRFEDLLREIAAGTPVIVLQDLGFVSSTWHYAVVVGYDYERGDIILRSGLKQRETLSFPAHEFFWRRGAYWAMVAMPPGRIPATADERRWLEAVVAYERVSPGTARQAYGAALERWPENLAAAIGLANAQHAAGDLRAAEEVLRNAAGRAPDSVIVLNNLAQTLSDLGRHEEALVVIDRAAAAAGPAGAPFSAEVQKTRDAILERLTSARGAGPGRR